MTKHSIKRKISRLGSLSKADLSLSKKDEPTSLPKIVETFDSQGGQLIQRCVIIQRGEKGYGLTVSGDNPVFVQSVKEDGAAAHAGVQQGDRIIKVNGTLVTQSNHIEVVKLIKSGSYVALTLLGRPFGSSPRTPGTTQSQTQTCQSCTPIPIPQANDMHSGIGKPSSPTERITGPQPVDSEKQLQLSNSKIQTISMMLEKDLAYLEQLRSEFAKSPTDKTRADLAVTQKRCRTLEEELFNLTGVHHDCGIPQPRSPPPTLRGGDSSSAKSPHLMKDSSQDFPPPLPPPRKFPLPHQTSLPNVTMSNTFQELLLVEFESGGSATSTMMGVGVPFSPSHLHSTAGAQIPMSHSLENIQQTNVPATVISSAIAVKNCRHPAHKRVHVGPTHSRQRSSPDALLHQTDSLRQQQAENLHNTALDMTRSHSEIGPGSRKLSTSDSFSDGDPPKRCRGSGTPSRTSSFGTYDSGTTDSPRITPPGTPPPPYSSAEAMEMGERRDDPSSLHSDGATPDSPAEGHSCPNTCYIGPQLPIISMEDDDFPSDNEMGQVDDHGPFNSLSKLWRHPAHLAIFMHFIISNSDPSSLFFYLLTDLYKEGNAKEMKKWAYEIHSSFLLPGAPLRVNNVDDNILHEIDGVLQRDLDKEEILRKVFWKARKKALEELNEQLAEFQMKRTLGLGSFFGPPDAQLFQSMHDKTIELKIIEKLLVPSLETLSENIETANNRTCALASSLATLLYKLFGIKCQLGLTLIDRCPTFLAKEKSRIKVFNRNKKSLTVQGHHFYPQHYLNLTYCNHCQLIIWGVGNQGYQCQNCEMNIDKACIKVVEETCIGALRNKKDKKRMSGLMDFVGKRKPSSASNLRKIGDGEDANMPYQGSIDSAEPGLSPVDRPYPSNRVEKLKIKYETLCEGEEKGSANSVGQTRELTPPLTGLSPTERPATNGESSKQRSSAIGRSESLRTRRENQRHSIRKRSDPSIPHSKSDAEETPGSSLHPSASSSSCSSSTRSLDSPSNSLETVLRNASTGSGGTEVSPTNLASTSPHAFPRRDDSNDSDFEAESDPPNWTESVDWDIVKLLKPKEKRRQEVINELFHTERTHVRNLKVLERVFYRPMQEQSLFADQLKLLFPNLEEMLEIHGDFNSMMKARKSEQKIVEKVADIMLQMFDGPAGEKLRKEAATFCAKQAIALEALKNRQRKDQKLAQFLMDSEGNPLCRRLQLKDIIPTGMQRLTKYPLLIENLAKYTPTNTEEYANLMRAMECSKEILNHVNQTVKDAENQQRLTELQKKLDKGSFEKADHPIAQEFRNLDLAKYKMIHEGPLLWRINRQKSIELHVLLLENVLVLLQKQDEKYVLKFHKEETKLTHSPIIQLCNLLTRNVATDRKAFFLVSTASTVGPQIYELVASGVKDRETWIRHITEAADSYRGREGKSDQRSEPITRPERLDGPEESNSEAEKSRDSLEPQEIQEVADTSEASDQNETAENVAAGGENSLNNGDNNPAAPDETPSVAASAPEDEDVGATAAASPSPPAVAKATVQRTELPAQRYEVVEIAEGSMLIEPSEVIVSSGAVLQMAEPVLTPLEKLRRKDALIQRELKEKRSLVAEVLHIPEGEFDNLADLATELHGNKDVKDLILIAIAQATKLTELINDSQNVNEEDAVSAGVDSLDGGLPVAAGASGSSSPKTLRRNQRERCVPASKLFSVSNTLSNSLNLLLSLVTEREVERDRMRKELRASMEQIHQLHESRQPGGQVVVVDGGIHTSRPSSFVSADSSESCELYPPIGDDGLVMMTESPCESTGEHEGPELFVDAPPEAADVVAPTVGEGVATEEDEPVYGAIF